MVVLVVVVFIVGTPFKNNFMRCYAGGDPGRASPVGQVRRATLAPFLYPLLFYQKSGQKSIIFCVANLTNRRKNRRKTALKIVQYDESHSARHGTLRQQESSPSRAPEAAPARRSKEQSGSRAPQAVQLSRESNRSSRGGAQQARPAAETEQRAESAPARRSSPAPEQRGRSHPAAGSRRRSRQHPESIPGSARG